MGQEIDGEVLGDDYKGYVFRITGGNDKQGFTMKQGIMVNGRVRILFKGVRSKSYRPRRVGMRRRRSVRGCIIGPDLAVIMLRVVKQGDKDIDKVTNADRPNRLGRKRASRIRKTFDLDRKLDDVRKYVIHRKIEKTVKDAEGNDKDRVYYKAPKIQRLITDKRIRRKKAIKNERVNRWKTSKEQKQKYEKLISQFVKEKKAADSAAKKAAEEAKAAKKSE
jgi:small subunit ribosomal protein S6e